MSMGIVNDIEFDLELKRSKIIREESNSSNTNDTRIPKIITIEKGRGNGNLGVPNGLRKIIGEESEINGRHNGVELASRFGIQPSSVSAYANGSKSTTSYDEQPNIGHINNAKERISKKARNRLILALNSLTSDKINDSKAREIASVAKDMSVIIRNMEPDNLKDPDRKDGPTFVFYAPQLRDEKYFDVIHSKE
jgi:hypothetical protein